MYSEYNTIDVHILARIYNQKVLFFLATKAKEPIKSISNSMNRNISFSDDVSTDSAS